MTTNQNGKWSRWLTALALVICSVAGGQQSGSLEIQIANKKLQVDYRLPDEDGNGLPDAWEERYFGHTGVNRSEDADGDGRANDQEFHDHTDPTKRDTDGDGLDDGQEAALGSDPNGTDPSFPDSIIWLGRTTFVWQVPEQLLGSPGLHGFDDEQLMHYSSMTWTMVRTGFEPATGNGTMTVTAAYDADHPLQWKMHKENGDLNVGIWGELSDGDSTFVLDDRWPGLRGNFKLFAAEWGGTVTDDKAEWTETYYYTPQYGTPQPWKEKYTVTLSGGLPPVIIPAHQESTTYPWGEWGRTAFKDGANASYSDYCVTAPKQFMGLTVKWKEIFTSAADPEHPTEIERAWKIDGNKSPTFSLGSASGPDGTYGIQVIGLTTDAEIAVDGNSDGEIKMSTQDASDATSEEKPFRFWLNDDDDGDPTDENEVYPVTAKDCDDFAIHGRRDLEDMARLHVFVGGLSDAIAADNPSIYVGLKWKTTTGSPAINIFPAVETDGGTKYLTDTATATQQAPASTLRTTVLTKDNQYKRVDTNGTFVFNKDFWTGLSSGSPRKYLLFEGCTEGKGELVLVLLRPDGTEISEGPGVWIDLKNIKSMYQRVKVTPRDPSGIPPPFLSGTTFDANGSGTEPSDDGYPFAAPADEAKTALVFVHGSNIPYEEARWNAETMLKRLWWQGYKGRFVLFYWDTLVGPWDGTIPAHYNLNEYRALKYGWALKNYVESALPSDYAHNVAGHSMGNAVITSALRAREAINGSTIPGMAGRNVVFMQAAMPASCFDSGAATLAELAALESPQTTPDGVGQMGYRGVIETGVNATLFNIYNENDYALGWWVTNQRLMKPEDLFYRGYARKYTWTTTGGGQLWDWSNIEAGPIRMRYLEDLSESMSFVARSRTAALGRMNVGGSISNNLNISEGTELDFGRDRPDHSGEFTRRIQQLGPFYRYLFERAR